jgi:hypothetical protein|tara:strand:- start:1667 stop:1972 length:306 start_codon:yes stop_codon:yes gene_type:complete
MPEELDPLSLDTDKQGRDLSGRSEPYIRVTLKGLKRGETLDIPISKWRKAKKDGYLSYNDTTLFVDGDTLLTEKMAKLEDDGRTANPIYAEGAEIRKKDRK